MKHHTIKRGQDCSHWSITMIYNILPNSRDWNGAWSELKSPNSYSRAPSSPPPPPSLPSCCLYWQRAMRHLCVRAGRKNVILLPHPALLFLVGGVGSLCQGESSPQVSLHLRDFGGGVWLEPERKKQQTFLHTSDSPTQSLFSQHRELLRGREVRKLTDASCLSFFGFPWSLSWL